MNWLNNNDVNREEKIWEKWLNDTYISGLLLCSGSLQKENSS